MKSLLRSLPHGIGLRPQDERDFYRICDLESIDTIWSYATAYCSTPYGSIISLDKKAKGIELMFGAWHELGHHFVSIGRPFTLEFFGTGEGRDELRADAIALIAICPTNYLHQLREILDVAPRKAARKIYDERLRLYFIYGI
jgi:hypothetical protein